MRPVAVSRWSQPILISMQLNSVAACKFLQAIDSRMCEVDAESEIRGMQQQARDGGHLWFKTEFIHWKVICVYTNTMTFT